MMNILLDALVSAVAVWAAPGIAVILWSLQ